MVARMFSARSRNAVTGIDIHPGATIGSPFSSITARVVIV